MKKNTFYLVTGVIFQHVTPFGVGFGPQGAVPILKEVINQIMFSGVIDTSADEGALLDHFGVSVIRLNEYGRGKVCFTKTYDANPAVKIGYVLYSQDNADTLWVGKWSFGTDEGLVRMNLCEVNKDAYYNPYKAYEELNVFLDAENLPAVFSAPPLPRPTGQPIDDLPF